MRHDSVHLAYEGLTKATKYTAASTVQLYTNDNPKRGWCTEHAFGKPLIESWTSAIVLQAVLSFRQLLQAVDRQVILQQFASSDPRDPDWPKWQRWEQYRHESEPESDVGILAYIDRTIVQAILTSPDRLPHSKSKTVSLLLFGPPGTAKTTIVKALADGLNWPLLSLSPGNFIERGLEYIEAQAKQVFDMLQRLSNVVVLFDECDELFRDRKPVAGTDQVRNITAFVTASMLPKLQELHDRGRVVFAICTNHLSSMDPAIKRGGRIDHLIGVGPPDGKARTKIIRETLADSLRIKYIGDGVDQLASETERFTRGEIERAAKLLISTYKSAKESRLSAHQIAEGMKPSLTIGVEDLKDFLNQKREFSHPHIERALR